MQLKAVPESLPEWLALKLNLVPLPLLHGQMFPVIAKAVLTAADRGIFSTIGQNARTSREIADACGLLETPATKLLQVLASSGYLSIKDNHYRLTPMARKWVLAGSESDLSDLLIYNNRVVWKWMEHLDVYLDTGVGIDYHRSFSREEWGMYQRAMQAVARSEVKEFARKCPIPADSRLMLDIGGAQGIHVNALKKRYPHLQAHILDLPEALEIWADPGAKENTFIKGSILETPLAGNSYDLVLMSSLAHHFSVEENRLIAGKVAEALKPGGVFVINEFVNPEKNDSAGGLVGTSSNLFFGLTSTSGTWKISEMQEWQKNAGLEPLKAIGYTGIPGRYQIVAKKQEGG